MIFKDFEVLTLIGCSERWDSKNAILRSTFGTFTTRSTQNMSDIIAEMKRSRLVDSPSVSVCPKRFSRSPPTTPRWRLISSNYWYFQWILLKMIGFGMISEASARNLDTSVATAFHSGMFSFGFWLHTSILYATVEADYWFSIFSTPAGRKAVLRHF